MRDYGIFGQCLNELSIIYTTDIKLKEKLELVFIKHYAPNICLSPNMAEFAVS